MHVLDQNKGGAKATALRTGQVNRKFVQEPELLLGFLYLFLSPPAHGSDKESMHFN